MGPGARVAAALVLAPVMVAATGGAAGAHVAPSERDNNRYLTVAPLGDRVRLAYTVFLGQIPGHALRRTMDKDGDGVVSDGEAQRWGDQLAAQVAARLELTVDGARTQVRWDEVDVSLNDPSVTGGAFAVDMVAWACFKRPHAQLQHRVQLYDRFRIPTPGESQITVEDSPGVRIVHSQFGSETGADAHPRMMFRWRGGPGPAGTDGYLMDLVTDPGAATFLGGPCPAGHDDALASPRSTGSSHLLRWLSVAAIALLVLLAAAWVRRSRKRG